MFPHWLSILLSTVAIALPLTCWAIISYAQLVPALFLPTPTAVIQSGIEMFSNRLIFNILVSCLRVASDFIFAAIVGVPIGILMGSFFEYGELI